MYRQEAMKEATPTPNQTEFIGRLVNRIKEAGILFSCALLGFFIT